MAKNYKGAAQAEKRSNTYHDFMINWKNKKKIDIHKCHPFNTRTSLHPNIEDAQRL